MLPPEAASELATLAQRFGLNAEMTSRLGRLVELLAGDPTAPTSVREPLAVVRDHVADALVALELEPVAGARSAVDIGSGAGVPALPLAICRPELTMVAAESVGRKAAFIARAAEVCGVSNLTVMAVRAEELTERGRFDLVTARALASLEVVAEYAAPVLALGGSLVVWRGRRDAEAEAATGRAAAQLGLEVGPVIAVMPYAGVEARHLHVLRKVAPTPLRFPRRPGVARKRPLSHGSDRPQR